MYEVAERGSARSIKLSVGETRTGAPSRGCRGLTQVEFDPASMVGAAGNGKDARVLQPDCEKKTAEERFGRFSRKENRGSGAAPPQSAVAPRDELQVVLVAGPLFVLRQL